MVGNIRTKPRNNLANDKLKQILRVKFYMLKQPDIKKKNGKVQKFRPEDFIVPEVKIILGNCSS